MTRTGQQVCLILERKRHRAVRIGLVAGGLPHGARPRFLHLEQLQGSARVVSDRLKAMDCEVVDVGFISYTPEGAPAAEKLRVADCDMMIIYLTTYLTSNMRVPEIAQRRHAPVLVIDMQPSEHMDHAALTPGSGWPTAASARCPRSPTSSDAADHVQVAVGRLQHEDAWRRIGAVGQCGQEYARSSAALGTG